jgi:GNAT superfamily N-acetyltransferase
VRAIVRLGSPADYGLIAHLFPELGVADPLPTSEHFAGHMLPRVVIADDDGTSVGYASWRCYGATAHVVNVVVAPEARGRGVAGALLEDVRGRVRAAGCTRWRLNVKQDNAVAIRVYERAAMAIEQEGWAVDVTWDELDALPGADGEVSEPAILSPSDDGAVASEFGVDAARLAQLREKPGEVIYARRAHGRPVAFAAFDPAYPGIHPIHVTRTDLARGLFAALRRHARHEHVHVAVEGNAALHEALRAVGGRLRHAFFRMGAPL